MRYDLREMDAKEVMPGFAGKFVHSDNMTLATWEIPAGNELPEHHHPHEQVVYLLEGEFELTLEGEPHLLVPGEVLVIASNRPHSGRAITDCKILDVFQPVREEYR